MEKPPRYHIAKFVNRIGLTLFILPFVLLVLSTFMSMVPKTFNFQIFLLIIPGFFICILSAIINPMSIEELAGPGSKYNDENDLTRTETQCNQCAALNDEDARY